METYKVLFVDDDEFIRKIYTDRLNASGLVATTASSAAETKTLLEEKEFDLVCLDYLLADETGLDVLNWMRKEKKIMTPVLVFSASGQEVDVANFMAAGATEYVQKDHVVPTELVEKIKKIIREAKVK